MAAKAERPISELTSMWRSVLPIATPPGRRYDRTAEGSDGRPAVVNRHDGAVDVAGVVGGEEYDHRVLLIRIGDAASIGHVGADGSRTTRGGIDFVNDGDRGRGAAG